MDSDNDGRINGFELGDFNCSWFEGQPTMGDATGHPGLYYADFDSIIGQNLNVLTFELSLTFTPYIPYNNLELKVSLS